MTSTIECPICQDVGVMDGSPEKGLAMVDCGHVYHIKCINELRDRGNQSCPSCRKVCSKVTPLFVSIVPTATLDGDHSDSEDDDEAVKDDDEVRLLYTTLMEDYDQLKENSTRIENHAVEVEVLYRTLMDDYSKLKEKLARTESRLAVKDRKIVGLQLQLASRSIDAKNSRM